MKTYWEKQLERSKKNSLQRVPRKTRKKSRLEIVAQQQSHRLVNLNIRVLEKENMEVAQRQDGFYLLAYAGKTNYKKEKQKPTHISKIPNVNGFEMALGKAVSWLDKGQLE